MGCNSGRIMVGGHDQNTGCLDDLLFIVQAHGQADLGKHRSEDDGLKKWILACQILAVNQNVDFKVILCCLAPDVTMAFIKIKFWKPLEPWDAFGTYL